MKSLVRLVLFVTLMAGFGFAMDPIAYKCESDSDQQTLNCSIAQFATEAAAVDAGYGNERVSTSWQNFLALFRDEMGAWNYSYINISFETDVDFGGRGDDECVEAFSPFELPYADDLVTIDGKSHVIRNFCYENNDQAYFFETNPDMLNNVLLTNLVFDSAFVMAKASYSASDNRYESHAAVVINDAINVQIDSVAVTNSKVYGTNAASVAISATQYWSENFKPAFKNVFVENVTLGETAGMYNDMTQDGNGLNRKAGVVITADNVSFENVKVTNLIVDTTYVRTESTGDGLYSYRGAYEISGAGLVSSLTVISGTVFTTLKNVQVDGFIVGGNRVGGLIGSALVQNSGENEAPSLSILESSVKNVAVKSPSYRGTTGFGGLIDSLYDVTADNSGKESVVLRNNTVDFSGSIGSGSESSFGGLISNVIYSSTSGYIKLVMDSNNVTLDLEAENRLANAYWGGLVGYVKTSNSRDSIVDSLNTIKFTVQSQNFYDSGNMINFMNIGGAYGYLDSPGNARLDVVKEDVTVDFSVTAFQGFLGGLVGRVKDYSIYTKTNKVTATIAGGCQTNYMGGLVGSFAPTSSYSTLSYLKWDSLTVELSYPFGNGGTVIITGAEEIKKVHAGGVIGGFETDISPDHSTTTVNVEQAFVKSKNSNIVSIEASETDSVFVGGLVGSARFYANLGLTYNNVQGNLNVEGSSRKLALGGFLGNVSATMYSYVRLTGNVSIGDILLDSQDSVGYIVGEINGAESYYQDVQRNCHYGTKDVNVSKAIGFMDYTDANNGVQVINYWRESGSGTGYNISRNYRNHIEDKTNPLNADGNLLLSGNGKLMAYYSYELEEGGYALDSTYWENGVIHGDSMKTRLFTYVMESSDTASWDGKAGELPKPVPSDMRTVYQLELDVSDVYKSLTEEQVAAIAPYLMKTAKMSDDGLPIEGDTTYTVYGYTGQNKKLDSDLQEIIETAFAGYAVVQGYDEINVLDLQKSFGEDVVARMVENRSFKIVYQYLDGNMYRVMPEEAVYLWPQVDSLQLFMSTYPAIPPVFFIGDSRVTYMPYEYSVKCKEGIESSCDDENGETGSLNFSFVKYRLASYTSDELANFMDTIYVVYRVENSADIPQISLGNKGDKAPLNGYFFGYKQGQLDSLDYENLGAKNGAYSFHDLPSQLIIEPVMGFDIDSFDVKLYTYDPNEENGGLDFFTAIDSTRTPVYEGKFADNSFVSEEDLWYSQVGQTASSTMDARIKAGEPIVFTHVINTVANGNQEVRFHLDITPRKVTAIDYKVSFDVNSEDYDIYFVDGWKNKIYSLDNDSTARLPMLEATNACFMGWNEIDSVVEGGGVYELSHSLLKNVTMGKDTSFVLYAGWMAAGSDEKQCPSVENTSMNFAVEESSDGLGSVYLWQAYENVKAADTIKHAFADDSLLIPLQTGRQVALPYTLNVGSEPDSGFKLARLYLETYTSAETYAHVDTLREAIPFLREDTSFQIVPGYNVKYKLFARFGAYIDVGFDIALEGGDSSHFGESVSGVISLVEGSGEIELPSWVYTSSACVIGWKTQRDGDSIYNGIVDGDALYKEVKGSEKLYGVWADADRCEDVGYNRLTLETEFGTISLDEVVEGDLVNHGFADDSTMLVPSKVMSELGFIVRALPAPGYLLDSVVAYDEKGTKVLTLFEGDTLAWPESKMTFKAFFSAVATEHLDIVNPSLQQSGNAIRLSFATSDVDADALVQVSLMDAQGNVIADSLWADPVGAKARVEWIKHSLYAGSYIVKISLLDVEKSTELDSFTLEFKVEDAGIVAVVDGWQMLAASVLDKKAVDWTDTGISFFWWDETSSIGEFWQYKAFGEKDELDDMAGIWYSSMEGTSLVVKQDLNVPEKAQWELDSIYSGWNMVANPYGWEIANPDTTLESWRWNAEEGSYTRAPKTLQPYEAIWVHVDGQKTVALDMTPVFPEKSSDTLPAAEKRGTLAKAADGSNWTLRAILADEQGRRDSWNVLGVGQAVQEEEPPEGMGDRVTLSIVEGRKRLAKSTKLSSDDGYTWNLTASASSNRRGFLSFEGLEDVAAYGYHVFVTLDDRTVELSAGENFPIALKTSSQQVKVQVVKSALQLATSISGLKTVQQGRSLSVSFNVPASMAGSNLVAEIAGLDGKKVASSRSKAVSGQNVVNLDVPNSGLYYVRVRVASQQTAGKVLMK